ncbi:MAG TPA: epoxide hydrolase [Phenylobacterium sp.]
MSADAIEAWPIEVPQGDLDDLRRRLQQVRWPERETVPGQTQGVPLHRLRALVDHWRDRYDWRRCEARLNAFGPHRTVLDGLGIHFLHVRSPHAGATPLLMTHGWPGSVLEFAKVIGPLTDPVAHGGKASDAFHVVAPALPGFGFSDKPAESGWTVTRTARAWAVLMDRLGYGSGYVAQGGDLGAGVTMRLAEQRPPGLRAIHLNFLPPFPPPVVDESSEVERRALSQLSYYHAKMSAYAELHRTRPQTLAYALSDSPVAQAAWMYDKFVTPTDDPDPSLGGWADIASHDEMLDDISLYWLTNSGGSSARLYWESFRKDFTLVDIDIPTGFSVFPREIFRVPRAWAESAFSNLVYWNEVESGGHFAAWEQPELFVDEIRACFRPYH